MSGLDLATFLELAWMAPEDLSNPRVPMAITTTPLAAASVLKFAFPGFVEHRGAVFLEFAFDQANVDHWFEVLGDPTAVENVVNHVHLWDVLKLGGELSTDAVHLVEPLASCWRSALAAAFPSRSFVVDAIHDGDYGPELGFQQVRGDRSV